MSHKQTLAACSPKLPPHFYFSRTKDFKNGRGVQFRADDIDAKSSSIGPKRSVDPESVVARDIEFVNFFSFSSSVTRYFSRGLRIIVFFSSVFFKFDIPSVVRNFSIWRSLGKFSKPRGRFELTPCFSSSPPPPTLKKMKIYARARKSEKHRTRGVMYARC